MSEIEIIVVRNPIHSIDGAVITGIVTSFEFVNTCCVYPLEIIYAHFKNEVSIARAVKMFKRHTRELWYSFSSFP